MTEFFSKKAPKAGSELQKNVKRSNAPKKPKAGSKFGGSELAKNVK